MGERCKFRGCKARPIFRWALCAIGDFSLCDEHDILLNRTLAVALNYRGVDRKIKDYEDSVHRRNHLRLSGRSA